MSKYFLKTKESQLIHGAEIFADYLEDREFVEEIEQKQHSRSLFTVQFVKSALEHRFPEHYSEILHRFVKMLIFDAIVGNNDRHFYNWGVINRVEKNKFPPVFSPIYDTARGLFWNESEEKVVHLLKTPSRLKKYLEGSRPKIGWEGNEDLNHFQLVKRIALENFGIEYAEIEEMLCTDARNNCIKFLESNHKWFSKPRLQLIKTCLNLRFDRLLEEIEL